MESCYPEDRILTALRSIYVFEEMLYKLLPFLPESSLFISTRINTASHNQRPILTTQPQDTGTISNIRMQLFTILTTLALLTGVPIAIAAPNPLPAQSISDINIPTSCKVCDEVGGPCLVACYFGGPLDPLCDICAGAEIWECITVSVFFFGVEEGSRANGV
jgi:hypothetical protein